ncbi:MAG: BNR-4 repeat-containing protein [Marinoscillum sp.]
MNLKVVLTLIIFFSLAFTGKSQALKTGMVTDDGSWCWFSDPRAIMVDGNVITGWVKANGTIEAAKLDFENEELSVTELYFMLEPDDHDNPAFTSTASGSVLAMYTRHSKRDIFINYLSDPGDFSFTSPQLINSFSDEQLALYPRKTMTYANPFRLRSENNRIYCFGRWTGFKPNMIWSDDDGASWSKSKVVITNYPFDSNNRPYVKYFSDGQSKIHLVFTDGHPRDEATNSVYYTYYEKGAFYNASGDLIVTEDQLPFEPKDASIVYTSNLKEGRAWVADIGQDAQGNPVILYTRSPNETNHEYWYARYTGSGWVDQKICDSGPWFPQTPDGRQEREPHYFGGMSIHPDNADVIYLSRQVNGVFEIERWETNDLGNSWKTEAITSKSEFDNVRPYLPRGMKAEDKEVVLWMQNEKYIHYTDYKSSIKYSIGEY